MSKIFNNNLSKGIVVIISLVILGAGVFSMAAMNHATEDMVSSQVAHNASDCGTPEQSQNCINFHFGLLEKFSHGFTNSVSFKIFGLLLALSVLLLVSGSLLVQMQANYLIIRTRLRQLYESTIFIFQKILGHWLSLLEKRDPSLRFCYVRGS